MKTVDEICTALICCLRHNDTSHCDLCPYSDHDVCCRVDLRDDVIAYLKYQKELDGIQVNSKPIPSGIQYSKEERLRLRNALLYIADCMIAVNDMKEMNNCNNCGIKPICADAPELGTPVRWNCPLWQEK